MCYVSGKSKVFTIKLLGTLPEGVSIPDFRIRYAPALPCPITPIRLNPPYLRALWTWNTSRSVVINKVDRVKTEELFP